MADEFKSIGDFINCSKYGGKSVNGERKVSLEDLSGKKIVVSSYSISDSQFSDCKSGKCVELHGYDSNDHDFKFFLKSGASTFAHEMMDLMNIQMEQFGHIEGFTCKVSDKKPYVLLND